ncbi:Phage major capsid protein E [Azotobacter beijerinckii]|uniref:Phage major capsid protein E n=1 Tax=Azotobacter beijerinckii TaxID=170623 RepID=A0A1H9JWF3_9GAMM|nr:major capsid protein [Azotobacter beijerinckii]SEQ91127.1 Phage major capsid protein E [Azotobacter beijerinckii]
MATLDIFNGDAFTAISLTDAINTRPEGQRVPTLLDSLFEVEGVNTTSVFIERENDSLALVPAGERGAPADVTTGTQRDTIPFKTLHLPTRSTIRADEVQGVRAFGSETELETVMELVGKRLMKMRNKLEATIRFQRAGAITGKIYDADGQRLLLDLHRQFGIEQQSQSMALGSDATKVLGKIVEAKRKAEDTIADSGLITGWLAVCGRGFWDAFTGHKSTTDAWDRFQDGQFLRTDMRPMGFQFGGVEWQEFYGKVGGVEFIGSNDAYLIPRGIDGLLVTKYAPADYMDTVNTMGQAFYASQEPLPHNKGIDLEAQSNPLSICTRPRAIIKLTA